jgi:hypothetical protein
MHIWLAILAGHVTRFGLSAVRFAQGKWRTIAVDIGLSLTPVPPAAPTSDSP